MCVCVIVWVEKKFVRFTLQEWFVDEMVDDHSKIITVSTKRARKEQQDLTATLSCNCIS